MIKAVKKRGRPYKLPPQARAMIAATMGRDKSERTRQEYANALIAAHTLAKEGDEFAWLFDRALLVGRGTIKGRRTLLSELGKIKSEATIIELARTLCRERPNVREAAAQIRRFRREREQRARETEVDKVVRKLLSTV